MPGFFAQSCFHIDCASATRPDSYVARRLLGFSDGGRVYRPMMSSDASPAYLVSAQDEVEYEKKT